MRIYTIDQFVRMSNAQLRKNLGKVTLCLLAKGVTSKELEQFFIAVAEITLRIDNGKMNVENKKRDNYARK